MAANPDKELQQEKSIPLLFLIKSWDSITNHFINQLPSTVSTVSADYLRSLRFLSPDALQTEITRYAQKNKGANLVNAQDENGQTLAHHIAANPAGLLDWETLTILFNNSPNLSIMDKDANTPMHIIASICGCDKDAAHMFMCFVDRAAKTRFDFSSLNNKGLSVLHMAAISQYGRQQPVEYILNAVKEHGRDYKIDFDVLSRSGSTALYYLLNHGRFNEAKMLVEAGANFNLHGDSAVDRHPYNYTLQLLHQLQNEEDERLRPMIDALQEIKTIMDNKVVEKAPSLHSTTKTEDPSVSKLLSSSLPRSWGASSSDTATSNDDHKDSDNKHSFNI